jgi:hypothetical protein
LATLNVNPGKESRTEESQDEQKQAPDGWTWTGIMCLHPSLDWVRVMMTMMTSSVPYACALLLSHSATAASAPNSIKQLDCEIFWLSTRVRTSEFHARTGLHTTGCTSWASHMCTSARSSQEQECHAAIILSLFEIDWKLVVEAWCDMRERQRQRDREKERHTSATRFHYDRVDKRASVVRVTTIVLYNSFLFLQSSLSLFAVGHLRDSNTACLDRGL